VNVIYLFRANSTFCERRCNKQYVEKTRKQKLIVTLTNNADYPITALLQLLWVTMKIWSVSVM